MVLFIFVSYKGGLKRRLVDTMLKLAIIKMHGAKIKRNMYFDKTENIKLMCVMCYFCMHFAR